MANFTRTFPLDDVGFAAQWSPAAARRQVNLALGLISSLAIAATIMILTLRFDPPAVHKLLASGPEMTVMLEGRSAATGHTPYGKLVYFAR